LVTLRGRKGKDVSGAIENFHSEHLNGNENEFSLVPSSPHPFIPFLIPYATHAKAELLIVDVAVDIGIDVVQ